MKSIDNVFVASEDALELRFGMKLSSHLNMGTEGLPHDISERLRHARDTAVARRGLVKSLQPEFKVVGLSATGTLSLGVGASPGKPWWTSLTVLVPVLALVAGLYLIGHRHAQEQIAAAAEIDAALLADELPPSAYGDPGFVEFLKTSRD